jgi:hypothetical protein
MSVKLGLILRKEYRMRVFENKVLRRIFRPETEEVAECFRKLHNEQLHNVIFSKYY